MFISITILYYYYFDAEIDLDLASGNPVKLIPVFLQYVPIFFCLLRAAPMAYGGSQARG